MENKIIFEFSFSPKKNMENKIIFGFNFSPQNIQAVHDPRKKIVTISDKDKKIVMSEDEFCQTARWLAVIADKVEGKL